MFRQAGRTAKWFHFLKSCQQAMRKASGQSGQPQWQETQIGYTQHIKNSLVILFGSAVSKVKGQRRGQPVIEAGYQYGSPGN